MQCPKCKIEIPDEARICPNCGINICEYYKDEYSNNITPFS